MGGGGATRPDHPGESEPTSAAALVPPFPESIVDEALEAKIIVRQKCRTRGRYPDVGIPNASPHVYPTVPVTTPAHGTAMPGNYRIVTSERRGFAWASSLLLPFDAGSESNVVDGSRSECSDESRNTRVGMVSRTDAGKVAR